MPRPLALRGVPRRTWFFDVRIRVFHDDPLVWASDVRAAWREINDFIVANFDDSKSLRRPSFDMAATRQAPEPQAREQFSAPEPGRRGEGAAGGKNCAHADCHAGASGLDTIPTRR